MTSERAVLRHYSIISSVLVADYVGARDVVPIARVDDVNGSARKSEGREKESWQFPLHLG
jgi:hypothetical protein